MMIGAEKSLYLPLQENVTTTSSRLPPGPQYEQCSMYKDQDNHSLGTVECIHGYEFHFREKEWNIVAEVKKI